MKKKSKKTMKDLSNVCRSLPAWPTAAPTDHMRLSFLLSLGLDVVNMSSVVEVLLAHVELVEGLEGSRLVASDVSLEPVWKSLLGVVGDEGRGGDAENLVCWRDSVRFQAFQSSFEKSETFLVLRVYVAWSLAQTRKLGRKPQY